MREIYQYKDLKVELYSGFTGRYAEVTLNGPLGTSTRWHVPYDGSITAESGRSNTPAQGAVSYLKELLPSLRGLRMPLPLEWYQRIEKLVK